MLTFFLKGKEKNGRKKVTVPSKREQGIKIYLRNQPFLGNGLLLFRPKHREDFHPLQNNTKFGEQTPLLPQTACMVCKATLQTMYPVPRELI